jgi:hypothetical protein
MALPTGTTTFETESAQSARALHHVLFGNVTNARRLACMLHVAPIRAIGKGRNARGALVDIDGSH